MATSPDERALLSLRGVGKSFGPVAALRDVDLDLHAGEVVALVGDNGAGKSTLVKAVAGTQPMDDGEFWFDGRHATVRTPKHAAALGIATVYQDLALCDNLDVAENLFLGRERIARGLGRPLRMTDDIAMEQRGDELLAQLAVTTIQDVHREVGTLSGGQRQSVAIARALIGEPRLVMLDEPTAALGVAQTAQVLALIDRLRERGLAVLVISHNLDNVFHVSDRIVVLRLGRLVGSYRTQDTTREEIVAAITGAAGRAA